MNIKEIINKKNKIENVKDIYYFTFDYEGPIHREDKTRCKGSDHGPSSLKRFLYEYGIIDIEINISDLGQVDKPYIDYHRKYNKIKSVVNFEEFWENHHNFLNKNLCNNGLMLNFSSTRESLFNILDIFNKKYNDTLLISIDIFPLLNNLYENMINSHSIFRKYLNLSNKNIKILNFGLDNNLIKEEQNELLKDKVFIKNITTDILNNLENSNESHNKIDSNIIDSYLDNEINYEEFLNKNKINKNLTTKIKYFEDLIKSIEKEYNNIIIHFSFESISNEFFRGQNYKNIEGGFNNKEIIELFKCIGNLGNKLKFVHFSDFNPFEEDYISSNFYCEIIYNLINNYSKNK